ncbi:hypothetical protein [Qipengyuania atrilutea]|uniref:DUF481 domain-containing protein n=1 Tax=Qipengyuania atrilutea TaxID=2744473 RepID=A0A850H5P3_9SPHN|nr:hypothetical protein [Actirhodobacter atriluteus]NVD44445.1 hypothetical protein [Actirhodobacter atriluteus]
MIVRSAATSLLRALVLLGAVLLPVAPLSALDDIDFDLRTTLHAVQADRAVFQGEDVESSGVGASALAGITLREQDTSVRIAVDAKVFKFSDDERQRRESLGISVYARQQVSEHLELEVRARRVSDIVTLESRSADQRAVRGQAEWSKGGDRIRLEAEWRVRDYDDSIRSQGEGPSFEMQYNRRFGSWHWARLTVRHDAIESGDAPRRSYEREMVRGEYSLPITDLLRFKPALEYRQWRYDAREAQGDPQGRLREDHLVSPEIGLAYGKSHGFYAEGSAEYEFRASNDERFGEDAPRFMLDVGYRF